jgi:two-component system response regulator VicR
MTEEKIKTVLVADDEQDLCSALESALSEADFRVVVANDGAAALEKFTQEQPDMVLLDIHMPKMTGIEVLNRIRKTEYGKNVPIAILTATDTMGVIADVTSIGELGTDFFSKTDFSLDQIVGHVKGRLSK